MATPKPVPSPAPAEPALSEEDLAVIEAIKSGEAMKARPIEREEQDYSKVKEREKNLEGVFGKETKAGPLPPFFGQSGPLRTFLPPAGQVNLDSIVDRYMLESDPGQREVILNMLNGLAKQANNEVRLNDLEGWRGLGTTALAIGASLAAAPFTGGTSASGAGTAIARLGASWMGRLALTSANTLTSSVPTGAVSKKIAEESGFSPPSTIGEAVDDLVSAALWDTAMGVPFALAGEGVGGVVKKVLPKPKDPAVAALQAKLRKSGHNYPPVFFDPDSKTHRLLTRIARVTHEPEFQETAAAGIQAVRAAGGKVAADAFGQGVRHATAEQALGMTRNYFERIYAPGPKGLAPLIDRAAIETIQQLKVPLAPTPTDALVRTIVGMEDAYARLTGANPPVSAKRLLTRMVQGPNGPVSQAIALPPGHRTALAQQISRDNAKILNRKDGNSETMFVRNVVDALIASDKAIYTKAGKAKAFDSALSLWKESYEASTEQVVQAILQAGAHNPDALAMLATDSVGGWDLMEKTLVKVVAGSKKLQEGIRAGGGQVEGARIMDAIRSAELQKRIGRPTGPSGALVDDLAGFTEEWKATPAALRNRIAPPGSVQAKAVRDIIQQSDVTKNLMKAQGLGAMAMGGKIEQLLRSALSRPGTAMGLTALTGYAASGANFYGDSGTVRAGAALTFATLATSMIYGRLVLSKGWDGWKLARVLENAFDKTGQVRTQAISQIGEVAESAWRLMPSKEKLALERKIRDLQYLLPSALSRQDPATTESGVGPAPSPTPGPAPVPLPAP